MLLSAGVNLEGISVELHHQLQHAAASAAQQVQRAKQADAAAAVRHGQAPEAAAAQAAAGAGDTPPQVAMEVVRRMVQRIFSTEDAVYRRVQASGWGWCVRWGGGGGRGSLRRNRYPWCKVRVLGAGMCLWWGTTPHCIPYHKCAMQFLCSSAGCAPATPSHAT